MLPDKLAINLDGWSSWSTHYVAIYSTFSSQANQLGYEQVPLAFSPIEVKSNQNADTHIKYLDWVLNVFEESLSSVSALCGDNCSTYRPISTKTGIGFVCCSSHGFDLFSRSIIEHE